MEDGIFKADHITIGDGCTIGAGAFVHYGVTIGDHAVITDRRVPHEGRAGCAAHPVERQPGPTVVDPCAVHVPGT